MHSCRKPYPSYVFAYVPLMQMVARPSAAEIMSELDCMWRNIGPSLIFDTDVSDVSVNLEHCAV